MRAGEPVVVPDAPPPAGHYSAGIKHGGLLYVSGQLGARADGSHTCDEPFEVQAMAALDNVFGVLAAAGCGKEDLLKVTVYVVGIENWPLFNTIYAQVMENAKPARAVVPVPELHYGYLVEIEALAACPT
jgi:2-iminobutanoate/2-iminopropanoate deaminase